MDIRYLASQRTLFVLAHGTLSAGLHQMELSNIEYAQMAHDAVDDLLSVLATEAEDTSSVEELYGMLFQLRDGLKPYQPEPVLN